MSDRSPMPAIFIACLSLLFLFAFPQASHSQSAIGQLEQMTGAHIGRFQPSGMPRMGGLGGMLGMMMLECIINGALDGSAANNPQLAAQQAAQRAELEAWMRAEQQRLATQVAQQRAKRDAEDRASMEELVAAMSQQWDGSKPASDLASALSDPQVTVYNPTGTPFFGLGRGSATMDLFALDPVKPTVDLSQRTSDVPRIPGSQQQVSSMPAAKPVSVVRQVQLRSQAAKKLQTVIKGNQNPKVLDQRLQKLQEELAEALRQAQYLQNRLDVTATDYDRYEQWLVSISGKTIMDGLGLALMRLGGLAWDYKQDEWIRAGGTTLLDRLTDLRNNPTKLEKTLEALEVINSATMMASDSIQYAVSEKDLENALDLIGNSLGANLPKPYDKYYVLGRSMIKSGMTIRKEFKIMEEIREMEGTTQAYLGKQKEIKIKIERLTKAIQEHRQQLAMKPDVPE